jgi:hypothetical protein
MDIKLAIVTMFVHNSSLKKGEFVLGADFRFQQRVPALRGEYDVLFWEGISNRLGKHEKILRSRVSNKVKGLGRMRKIILNLGYIVRKEDRGGRYIICSKEWEDNQLSVVLGDYIKEGETNSMAHIFGHF